MEVVIHYPDGTRLTTDDGKLQDKFSAQVNQRIRVILSKDPGFDYDPECLALFDGSAVGTKSAGPKR